MPLSGSLCTPKSTPIKLGLSLERSGARRPSVALLRSSPQVLSTGIPWSILAFGGHPACQIGW
jgi:hypothetical protein